MSKIIYILLLIAAVAVPATLYATQGGRESIEARVAAFKHENGAVEFAIQVKENGDWGERILPDTRTMGSNSLTGRWLASSPVSIEVPDPPEPIYAPEPEVTGIRFDLAVALRGEDVVIEAVIDGERFEWPVSFTDTDQNGDPRGKVSHQFAEPERVRDRETREWRDINRKHVLVVRVTKYDDLQELRVTLDIRHWNEYWEQQVFTPRHVDIPFGSPGTGESVPIKSFTINPRSLFHDPIRQTPCTAEEVKGNLAQSYAGGERDVVAHAYTPSDCQVSSSQVIRENSAGQLYGTVLGGGSCSFSVKLIERMGPFARYEHTYDRGCEISSPWSTEHYFVVREWNGAD